MKISMYNQVSTEISETRKEVNKITRDIETQISQFGQGSFDMPDKYLLM